MTKESAYVLENDMCGSKIPFQACGWTIGHTAIDGGMREAISLATAKVKTEFELDAEKRERPEKTTTERKLHYCIRKSLSANAPSNKDSHTPKHDKESNWGCKTSIKIPMVIDHDTFISNDSLRKSHCYPAVSQMCFVRDLPSFLHPP